MVMKIAWNGLGDEGSGAFCVSGGWVRNKGLVCLCGREGVLFRYFSVM